MEGLIISDSQGTSFRRNAEQ